MDDESERRREIPAISGVLPAGLAEQDADSRRPDAERPETLDDWQRLIVRIFAKNNAFMSPKTIWLRAVEQSGDLAEALRKEEYTECADVLADLLAWILAFSNKVGITLSDAVWAKYPGVCPYCVPRESELEDLLNAAEAVEMAPGTLVTVVRRCNCGLQDYPPYDAGAVRLLREHSENKPHTLEQWQALFAGVYGPIHQHQRGADALAYHLQEEIAEVSREIRLERFQEAQEELADVFSWVLCLASKLSRFPGIEIIVADALWANYPGRCKVCRESVCHCDDTAANRRRVSEPSSPSWSPAR